jgi:hypothetical protein
MMQIGSNIPSPIRIHVVAEKMKEAWPRQRLFGAYGLALASVRRYGILPNHPVSRNRIRAILLLFELLVAPDTPPGPLQGR